MKTFHKTALAAAMAMVVAVPAANAAGSFDGFVSGAVGAGQVEGKWGGVYCSYAPDCYNYSYGKDDTNTTLGKFRMTGNYLDASGFGGQMDFVYGINNSDWVDTATTDFAGHVFYRKNDWLVGLIGQHRSYDFTYDGSEGGSSTLHSPLKVTFWGLEAQKQLGSNMSVYAQLGYEKANLWGDDLKGWAGAVEGRYFVHDNLLINAKVGYGDIDWDNGCTPNTTTWCERYIDKNKTTVVELGAEYRMTGSPFSFFGNYTWSKSQNDSGWAHLDCDTCLHSNTGYGDYTQHQFMVGVKFNMGKETLRQRDRDGASLNPMELLGADGANWLYGD